MIGTVKASAGIKGKLVVRDELGGGLGEGKVEDLVRAPVTRRRRRHGRL